MTIALFPGSFNPIHFGHVNLASHLIEKSLVEEVWMLISPCNPLKKESELIHEAHRLAMAHLALSGHKGLVASDEEFSMPRPSFTIDTIRMLIQRYPMHCFSLMIGSDNALIFNQWKEHQALLDLVQVYVYPRNGYPADEAIRLYPAMKSLDTPFHDISSTLIRKSLMKGKNTGEWLHPEVLNYIRDNKLYFFSTDKD